MYSNYTNGDQGAKGSLDLQTIVGIVGGLCTYFYHCSTGVLTRPFPLYIVLFVLVIIAMLSVAYCPLGENPHIDDAELTPVVEEANPLAPTPESQSAPPPPYDGPAPPSSAHATPQ